MDQDSVFVRRIKIRQLESKMHRLFKLVDATPDPDTQLKLWWQIEECRFELENLCGADLSSGLLWRQLVAR